jgi:hypothetical protein
MNPTCQREWIHEFMVDSFPTAFLDGPYKRHRENVLFDRETSYMPATLVAIEQDRQIAQARQDLNGIQERIRRICLERHRMMVRQHGLLDSAEFFGRWTALQTQLEEAGAERRRLRERLREVTRQAEGGDGDGAATTERRQFVRACPADGCKGFLSTAWKCGLCHVSVCKDCHEIIAPADEAAAAGQGQGQAQAQAQAQEGSTSSAKKSVQQHTCRPESLETAKLLAKDSKPCPNCASLIFKIDGCDQMFCTVCHTAFSWRTCQVVTTGRIHNPHYYEWLRSRTNGDIPREPGDNPCGGENVMPDIYELRNFLFYYPQAPEISELYSHHREITHIQHYELHRFRAQQVLDVRANMDIRKRYMLNEISQEKFKQLLQRREKARMRNHEYYQIFDMFIRVATEIVIALTRQAHASDIADVQRCIRELRSLRDYTVQSLNRAAIRFGAVSPARIIFGR